MRAALLYGKEDLRLEELPLPEVDSGGIVLKMKACGICGSDSRMYFNGLTSRYLQPIILGHECCAEVIEADEGEEGLEVGDLVAIAPVIPCMRCSACARGKDNICERAGVIGCTVHGGMAEYISIPAQMLRAGGVVRLPAGVTPRAGALAEVVGCCLHALRQTGLNPADRVLILGGGPVGMTFLQLARLMGAGWVGMTGRRAHRLRLARELGADEIIDVAGGGLGDRFKGAMDLTILANASVPSLKEAI
jgi:L-iditol 2-dehydrogenase